MTRKRSQDVGKGHRLALTSRLLVLDETLCDFERWAQGWTVDSAMYAHRDNLSGGQKEAILEEIGQLRERIGELREACGLRRKREEARRAIITRCAMLWELLIELEPKYLRRYGALPEGLEEYLEPRVAEIQRGVEAIGRIATERPEGKGAEAEGELRGREKRRIAE